ncbi:MAG: hypothetical protein ILP17_00345, partial [Lachnospiraceae bacterium]|nr:hypothetical protein [Lachnospiraceae bacterium]
PKSTGKKPELPVSNGKKPELPKSTGKKPELPVSNGKKPELPKSTGKKPELPVSNGKKPELPKSTGKKPELPVSNGKKPELPKSTGKKPELPVSNGKKPELPKSTGKKPELPVSNGKKPELPKSTGKKPELPVSNGKKPEPQPKQQPAPKRGSKKKDHDREITIILSAILLVLTIAGIILFFVLPDPNAVPQFPSEVSEAGQSVNDTDEEGGQENEEPSEPEKDPDETGQEVTPVEYSAPDYSFAEEDVYIELPGITREYTIAWVSDVHIISDFEAGDVYEGSLETVLSRYETLSVTPDGVHGMDLWPEIIDYLNYNDFDGVIFGGDLLDYCSTSNMNILTEGLDRLKYPSNRVLYIRADHDYGTWYSDGSTGFDDYKAHELHARIDGDDNTHKYLDFGDFIIAGVNNSIKKPGEEQMEVLTGIYNLGIPVIAATHVPYYSQTDPSLDELSMLVRNKIYYWSPESENYNPDSDMWKYLDMIYSEDSNCAYVLAGHLHAEWEGEIRDGLTEHIFSPAFSGTIGVVHIIPEKD